MTCATRWAALACLVLPACLPGAPSDPWLKITSANFELYTTAGERSGRDLIRHFEQVRSFFVQAFGGRLPAGRPARIIAFRNEKEYEPYRPNEFADAYYLPGSTHDFIVMSSASRKHYPVAVHEFTHLMIHQSGMDVPPWLNEGLAELYSNLEPRDNRVLVGEIIPGRLQVLRTEAWIPLATLLNADRSSPYYNERSRAGMFYAESWALVHMLNLDAEYRPHLSAMALALKDGNPEAAFSRAYGKRIDEVEAALRAYFSAPTIHAELFNVQLPKSVESPQITAAAALPARIALAELLGNMRARIEQADAAYRQLAGDFPQNCEIEAGQAEFAWRQRKLEDAASHFARAVELGCKDLPGLLLYARVLGYARRDQEAVAVLTRTAGLFPESDEVRLELGSTLVRTGDYGAAAAALVAVKKLTSSDEAYRLFSSLAYAQYRLGDAPHARLNIAKARSYTTNPGELASLDRLQQAVSSDESGGAPPASGLPFVEGTLENMECGKVARLHVRVDGEIRIFVIPDPTRVVTRTGSGGTMRMQCGPQKPPRAVRIEYQELPSADGVAGLVRALDFR